MANNITDLGKVGMTLKGEWNSSASYERLDAVTYEGSLYIAIRDNSGSQPSESNTNWMLGAKHGEFTEQQLEDFKRAVVAESKTEMDNYTDDQKDELDTYTNTKKGELDTYEETKESELETVAETLTTTFNTNATQKTTDYNDNATEKTNTFNTNVTTKTETFDQNATTKQNAFNTNATEKTNAFNTNAESKTTDFNTNASTKTDTFNTNATDKTENFDNNAEEKQETYDTNATEKIDEYNQNASEKIQEYNNNSATTDKAIELLAEEHYDSVTVEGESITVDDAEEFYGSINIKGKSEQDQDEEVSPTNVQEIENVIGNIEVTANEETTVFPLAEGQRMYKGDYLAEDGIHHARKQIILDGTETWAVYGSGNTNNYYCYWTSAPEDMKLPETADDLTNSLCNYLKEVTWRSVYSTKTDESGIAIRYDNSRIYIKVPQSTVTELAEWLSNNNLVLEYPLAEEEVESYTSEQQTAYNKLKKVLLQEGTNNITATSEELNPILELTYKKIKDYTTEEHEDEQDSKIANLQQEVTELAENALWNTTDQGTYVDVADAAKYSKNKIAVTGRSWQDSRSGKNSIKALSTRYADSISWVIDKRLVTSNMVFSAIFPIALDSATIFIQTSEGNSNVGTIASTANQKFEKELTLTETQLSRIQNSETATRIQIYKAGINFSETNPTEVMLRDSKYDDTYEPYGAMPSPEFPSAIQNVTGNMKITDINENLFDEEILKQYKVDEDEESYIFNNQTLYNINLTPNKKFKENTAYTIDCQVKQTTGSPRLQIKYTDGTSMQIPSSGNISTEYTRYIISTNPAKTIDYLSGNYGSVASKFFYIKKNSIQIIEGIYTASTIPEYKKHAEHSVTFPLQEGQRMYEGSYLAEDGIHHVRKQVVLDGNENWEFRKNGEIDGVMYYKYSTTLTNRYKSFAKFISTIGTNNQYSAAAQIVKNDKGLALYNSNNSSATVYLTTTLATVAELKFWLAENPVKLEYELEEETIEPYTTEQQQAWDNLQKFMLYKGVNHITAESDELEPNMQLTYMQDTNTVIAKRLDNIENRLSLLE